MSQEIEKRIQLTTQLKDQAETLRQKTDEVLYKCKVLNETGADVIDISSQIGSLLKLVATRLKEFGVAMPEWLAANVPNLSEKRAKACIKVSNGDFSDPKQIWLLEEYAQPKQIEDKKEESTQTAPWFTAWRWITHIQKLDLDGWPQTQVDMTRDNIAQIVKKFGGEVVWQ